MSKGFTAAHVRKLLREHKQPLKQRIAELEALNASYNCDRERHHRLIDKLQAKLDAAKDGEAE